MTIVCHGLPCEILGHVGVSAFALRFTGNFGTLRSLYFAGVLTAPQVR